MKFDHKKNKNFLSMPGKFKNIFFSQILSLFSTGSLLRLWPDPPVSHAVQVSSTAESVWSQPHSVSHCQLPVILLHTADCTAQSKPKLGHAFLSKKKIIPNIKSKSVDQIAMVGKDPTFNNISSKVVISNVQFFTKA